MIGVAGDKSAGRVVNGHGRTRRRASRPRLRCNRHNRVPPWTKFKTVPAVWIGVRRSHYLTVSGSRLNGRRDRARWTRMTGPFHRTRRSSRNTADQHRPSRDTRFLDDVVEAERAACAASVSALSELRVSTSDNAAVANTTAIVKKGPRQPHHADRFAAHSRSSSRSPPPPDHSVPFRRRTGFVPDTVVLVVGTAGLVRSALSVHAHSAVR